MRTIQINGNVRNLSGWKKSKPDHRDLKLVAAKQILPTHVDLRPGCPAVLDQGSLGSCTANSACTVMEFLQKRGQEALPYSRLYIYYWSRIKEGTPPEEDSGAEIRDVMKVLAKKGAPYESSWPYIIEKFSVMPPTLLDTEASKHRALFYYACPSLFTLKASLAHGFPVTFGFSVPDNMLTDSCAKTGLVYYPSLTEGFQGGHAVTAVGYDDNMAIGKDTGAILCQNSWGTEWGQKGFFWLPYRFWVAGLADDCWTIRKTGV